MICFFWDLISLRKRSTKSGLACEASFGAEVLTASFLAGVEFYASAEFAAANTTSVRVITRSFFWFMGLPFMYGEI
jgi:hypothetical protein